MYLILVCIAYCLMGCSKEPIFNESTFIDTRDDREYKWVKIGEQVWMAENLAYLPSVADPMTKFSNTSPVYYVFGYYGKRVKDAKATGNYNTYGTFFNWIAAKTACPSGWHLPTDAEWKILERNLGMSQSEAAIHGWRYSGSVGKALKYTSGWYENGNGDNISGFTAIPAGMVWPAVGSSYLEVNAFFWSSSENGERIAWYRHLTNSLDGICRDYNNTFYGYSVRCIKDN